MDPPHTFVVLGFVLDFMPSNFVLQEGRLLQQELIYGDHLLHFPSIQTEKKHTGLIVYFPTAVGFRATW